MFNVQDNLLNNILIRRNVINPEGLKQLREHIESSKDVDLSVFDPKKTNETGETQWRVDKEVRDTQSIDPTPVLGNLKDLLTHTVRNVINPFYNIKVDSSEMPQILSYSVGGHYLPHIDAESKWKTPDGDIVWKKSTDRDISFVYYLNDDFEGGDFVFPELALRIRPEPGMFICFPSTNEYMHGVEPVTKGKRYSIVTWATVRGFKSIHEVNKEFSEKYGVPVN